MALRLLSRKAVQERKLAEALAKAAKAPEGSQRRAKWLAEACQRRDWLVDCFPNLTRGRLPEVPAR